MISLKKVLNNLSRNRSVTAVILGLIVSLIILLFSSQTILLDSFERLLYDSFFLFREPTVEEIVSGKTKKYIPDDIVFAAIDDKSQLQIGKWPWPRDIHGRLLGNIEKFGVDSVFFDILFANPEQMPDTLRKKIEDDPALLSAIESYYKEMDSGFAQALSKTENVFIASKLAVNEEEAASKLRLFTEQRLTSIPAPPGIETLFKSSLPLWKNFADSASPLIVNQYLDADGAVRSSPLLIPYRGADEKPRYYLSAALSLVLDYFRAEADDIEIDEKKLTIRNAKVPVVDEDTGEFIKFREDLTLIEESILEYPEEINPDLLNYLINEYGYYYPDDQMPVLPLSIRLEQNKKGFKLLGGREVIEAAKILGIKEISYILYEPHDFKISHRLHNTGNPFTFLINYAGNEQIRYSNPYTDEIETHSPVTIISYADIAGEELPELPNLLKNPADSINLEKYKQWFTAYCKEQADKHPLKFSGGIKTSEQAVSEILNSNLPGSRYVLFQVISEMIQNETPEDFKRFAAAPLEMELQIINNRITASGGDEEQLLRNTDIFHALQDTYAELIKTLYGSHLFIGYQSRGITYDLLQTPYDSMFGTHVLINAVSTIITGNQLQPILPLYETLLIILLSLGFAFLYSRLSSKIKGLIFAVQMIVLYFAGYLIFTYCNIVINMSSLLSSQILLFISSTLVRLLFEEKDKRFYQSTFSRYLSPTIIDALYESGEHPQLGGESQTITAFFSDIEGFTTISEALTPELLVDFLNTYLSAMTSIIVENQGTLDKYIGDAIVAFYGAPFHYEDTPLQAVTSALLIQRRLNDLKKIWKEMNQPWNEAVGNIHMRIGLNTGNIITGNIGSYMRMDYTMIGDDVNLAARLESAAKQYGIYTLMSDKTYHHQFICDDGESRSVSDFIHARFIDRIIVKGKSKPVDIYEPLFFSNEENKALEQLKEYFSRGIEKYLKMDWTGAISEFERSSEFENSTTGKTNPSLKYIERCRLFLNEPPASPDGEWDGVFVLKNK